MEIQKIYIALNNIHSPVLPEIIKKDDKITIIKIFFCDETVKIIWGDNHATIHIKIFLTIIRNCKGYGVFIQNNNKYYIDENSRLHYGR